MFSRVFLFNDPSPTEISALSLHDALPISVSGAIKIDSQDIRNYTLNSLRQQISFVLQETLLFHAPVWQNIAYGKPGDRKSTRLNSSHSSISYAVFCLKKKTTRTTTSHHLS